MTSAIAAHCRDVQIIGIIGSRDMVSRFVGTCSEPGETCRHGAISWHRKTGRAMKLTIPHSILLRAGRMIE